MLADYNADIWPLFTQKGRRYLAEFELSQADRFHAEMLLKELDQQVARQRHVDQKLSEFAQKASIAEREACGVLASIPGVGPITIDVVLSEIGDIRRFRSQREATAYARLVPGVRESAGRAKQLGITKEGSRLLRWALVQTAWRLVNRTRYWGFLYNKLKRRRGAKKAIVAIARRARCMMVAMLTPPCAATEPLAMLSLLTAATCGDFVGSRAAQGGVTAAPNTAGLSKKRWLGRVDLGLAKGTRANRCFHPIHKRRTVHKNVNDRRATPILAMSAILRSTDDG